MSADRRSCGSRSWHWCRRARAVTEIARDVIPELISPAAYSDDFDPGIAINESRTLPSATVTCGDRITLDVRLSSDTYDAQHQRVCTGVGFGPSTSLDLVIECDTCPDPVEGECNFPHGGAWCSFTTTDPWTGDPATLACSCGSIVMIDEPRYWVCPVF